MEVVCLQKIHLVRGESCIFMHSSINEICLLGNNFAFYSMVSITWKIVALDIIPVYENGGRAILTVSGLL